ncbi:BRO1 domain-containing protein [Mycena indigotica]|uniref:pH-response regulator protein palC n=1 Tax=Mycena indigotica TaxID=2126181 RepID=A0A8H6W2K7_9AGAR|nr:BRO1 domain-containing protein [Mycena indigotica]KAF7297054.1 BRO1 domain-containing protein [Mycena indigotica]
MGPKATLVYPFFPSPRVFFIFEDFFTIFFHFFSLEKSRANLRAVLKESKRTQIEEKDHLNLVKVLEEYLPKLRGLIACVDNAQIELLQSEPIFSWRTTLSANFLHHSPRLALPSFYAELAYALLTYAFALSNLAHAKVALLGAYERNRNISEADRKGKDNQLNVAADLLYRWDRSGSSAGVAKPPDLTQNVNNALAKLALADAQTLAIRKLLFKSAYDSNVTPGPPLPKSHPSPALISKLHLECAALYSSARTLAKTSGSTGSNGKGININISKDGEVSTDLRRYLNDETAIHEALAHKWLGVDAGENGGTDRGGDAVAFLARTKKELEELKGRKKDSVSEELESVTVFLKHYKKINDSLHFQPVPSQADLQSRIPAGRLVQGAKTLLIGHSNIFALGDAIDYVEQKQVMKAMAHSGIFTANIVALDSGSTKLKPYKGSTEMIIVTNGKNGGPLYSIRD